MTTEDLARELEDEADGYPTPPEDEGRFEALRATIRAAAARLRELSARTVAAENACGAFAHWPKSWDYLPDDAHLLLTVLRPASGHKLEGLPWRMRELRAARDVMRRNTDLARAAQLTETSREP